jgi:hypothetical protein
MIAREKLSMKYLVESIAAMDPADKLYLTYDLVWKAANEGDGERVLQLLLLLRKAINFEESPLIGLDALRLYTHCEALIREKQDYPAVAHVFFELKRALRIASNLPDSPEEDARRSKADEPGALYFGKNGVHYGPQPRRDNALADSEVAQPPAGDTAAQ